MNARNKHFCLLSTVIVMITLLLTACAPAQTAVKPTITAIPELCGAVGTIQRQQTSYTTQNSKIWSNAIRSLSSTKTQLLSIGFAGDKAGVDIFTGTVWYHCLDTVQVNYVTSDWYGRIWVGTDGQGIWMFDGSWHQFTTPNLESRIYHITLDWVHKQVFATTWEGVWLFNEGDGTWSQVYVVGKNIYQQHIHAFLITRNGCLVFGSISDGGTMYCNGKWTPLSTPEKNMAGALLKLGGDNIRDIESPQGAETVWFISDGGKAVTVYDYVNDQWATYSLPNNRGQNIDFDRYGRPCVATYGGLYCNTSSDGMALGQWIQVNDLPGYSIAISGDIYFYGTQTSGLYEGTIPPYNQP